jgi:hypothetical protein
MTIEVDLIKRAMESEPMERVSLLQSHGTKFLEE